MKKCELCRKIARMYCNSDEASLCWDCDSRVHTANFLVSKHARTLLCHACQCPTSWTGSGTNLGPMIYVCDECVRDPAGNRRTEDDGDGDDDDDDDDSEDDEEEEEENDGFNNDDDDGENQVVPLVAPPPSFASTSTSAAKESSSGFYYNAPIESHEEKNGEHKKSWTWR